MLFLVPTPLGPGEPGEVLPQSVLNVVRGLDGFIAEEPKSARAFLKHAGLSRPLAQVNIETLNEHTPPADFAKLLEPLVNGARIGLLSEAGYPAVADPGAGLIALAHTSGIRVVPLVGPSSIILALAASGLNGQNFCCHGYLPVPVPARISAIQALEARSMAEESTQVFIETPYRNNQLARSLLETCRPDTRLCLAVELTTLSEFIATRTVGEWRLSVPDLDRRPTVFLLQAVPSASASTSGAGTSRQQRSRTGARSARRGFRGA